MIINKVISNEKVSLSIYLCHPIESGFKRVKDNKKIIQNSLAYSYFLNNL